MRSLLLAAILWLMQQAGNHWWIYAWLLWMAFSLTMIWAYPAFIAPLFNTFSQLDDDGLERFAEPVLYLPWCATVADALEKMSHRDREVTVVVNEFGDTIGILTIEDILDKEPWKGQRASKMDLDDFLQLLSEFNDAGIHFC